MIEFHWKELKYRLFYWFLSYCLIFLIIWYFKLEILFSLTDLNLIFTSLTEAFKEYIYFSVIISFIFSFPVLLYQYILFLIPGLYEFEFKNLLLNLLKYGLLFIIFYGLCFNTIFNFIIDFFISFESDYLKLELKIADFISFFNSFLLSFILLFLLPFLDINLTNKRKFIYMGLLIFIALITPPDIFSLIITIIPLVLLFEIKQLWSLIVNS